ncbi:MAG: tRNA (adenosine(37)-N6)-dimethylallyltransferase MiaA [Acidobacteriaceae bacterium]
MPSSSSAYSQTELENKASLIPLLVILGPTGVGKSELAVPLAEKFEGEIVSADSRTFYRGMDIGTAKPSLEERRRVPHHLIDVADPDETWSLALFQREASKIIGQIHQREHLPFLVGGTGQYLRAVIEGWKIPSVVPEPRSRAVLTGWAKQFSPVELQAKLALLDPQAASRIDPSNVRRMIRAFEVIFSSGKRFSGQRLRGENAFSPLLLGLTCPRPELYQRIDERISSMISCGLIEEVQRLLGQGYSPQLPTMSAIGYGEIVSYLQGEASLDEAVRLMQQKTRRFVRRQANWFKPHDPEIHWVTRGEGAIAESTELISLWLKEIEDAGRN